jgi:hypothetical protein
MAGLLIIDVSLQIESTSSKNHRFSATELSICFNTVAIMSDVKTQEEIIHSKTCYFPVYIFGDVRPSLAVMIAAAKSTPVNSSGLYVEIQFAINHDVMFNMATA